MIGKKLSTKLIVSAGWLLIGFIVIIIGICLKSPDFETKAFELSVTNSANSLFVPSFVAMSEMVSKVFIKYFVLFTGIIMVVISTIGIAGSFDNMSIKSGIKNGIRDLEKSIFDDDLYYNEECSGECDSCEMDCEAAVEEVAEELTEEEFEQKDE